HSLQVDEDRGSRSDALGRGIGLERRHVDDREIRHEPIELGLRRAAEQVPREDAGPGRLRVDPQRAAMSRVGADEEVLAVEPAILDVPQQAAAEREIVLLSDRVVDLTPPDVRLAGWLADDELVLRRAAGVLAGPDHQRSLGRDDALALANRVLV